MDLEQQQQQSVAYFMVTEDQLRQVAEEGARFVLEKYGVNTDEIREKMVINDKDEYRPVSYWLKKNGCGSYYYLAVGAERTYRAKVCRQKSILPPT